MSKVYIIHQYESCEYGEYYGIHGVYLTATLADYELIRLSSDSSFDYNIEEQEVIDG